MKDVRKKIDLSEGLPPCPYCLKCLDPPESVRCARK